MEKFIKSQITNFGSDSYLVELNSNGDAIFANSGEYYLSDHNYSYRRIGKLKQSYNIFWNDNEWQVAIGNTLFKLDTTTIEKHTLNKVVKSTKEDTLLDFEKTDFTESIQGAGNILSVRIDSLPHLGTLYLHNTPVTSGTIVSRYKLKDLTYQPLPDTNGADSIYWNGYNGLEYAEENELVSIEILPVNDVPVITGSTSSLTTLEETSLLITIDDLIIEDPDNTFPKDFSLTVIDGANYSVSNSLITPDTDFNGILSVSVSVNDGIDESNPFSIEVEVIAVLGLNEELVTNNYSIYPNPVNDQMIIHRKNSDGPYQLEIYSLDGKVVYAIMNKIKTDNYSIDLNPLRRGVYLVRIFSKNKENFIKIIRE